MIQTRFDDELQIIQTKARGLIHFDDLEQHYAYIYETKGLPRDLKVLIDATSANFNLTPANIEMMLALAAECLPKYNSISEAIIADQKYERKVATLFSDSAQLPGFQFQLFSNKTDALQWLNR